MKKNKKKKNKKLQRINIQAVNPLILVEKGGRKMFKNLEEKVKNYFC